MFKTIYLFFLKKFNRNKYFLCLEHEREMSILNNEILDSRKELLATRRALLLDVIERVVRLSHDDIDNMGSEQREKYFKKEVAEITRSLNSLYSYFSLAKWLFII